MELSAQDSEMLLVSYLNEILYLINVKKWIPCKISQLSIKDNKLKVVLSGTPFSPDDRIKTEIKAATYHNICIKKKKGLLEVEVLFDV